MAVANGLEVLEACRRVRYDLVLIHPGFETALPVFRSRA